MGRRTGHRDEKAEAIKRLQSLCNVGLVTAERLYSLGIETPEQMKQSDPEARDYPLLVCTKPVS